MPEPFTLTAPSASPIAAPVEAFRERAAIMEYDGGLSRPEAEQAARLLVLRGGLTVREDVVAWLIDKDLAGVMFEVRHGRVYPSPLEALTEADRAFLRDHRWQVLGMLGYEAPEEVR